MALPCWWVWFHLITNCFPIDYDMWHHPSGMLAWMKFPHGQASTGDVEMFSNLTVLLFLIVIFFYLLIPYRYVLWICVCILRSWSPPIVPRFKLRNEQGFHEPLLISIWTHLHLCISSVAIFRFSSAVAIWFFTAASSQSIVSSFLGWERYIHSPGAKVQKFCLLTSQLSWRPRFKYAYTVLPLMHRLTTQSEKWRPHLRSKKNQPLSAAKSPAIRAVFRVLCFYSFIIKSSNNIALCAFLELVFCSRWWRLISVQREKLCLTGYTH